MVKLRLESSRDVLNLNEIAEKGTGVQALSGATGLGLPPVSLQWLEGAGDGAKYRGGRVLPRDIDLPLDFLGRDTAHLTELLSKVARALAEECTLFWTDATGHEWYTKVVRTGGGDFVYGVDTIGERDLQTVITLRAGDPYFTSVQPVMYPIIRQHTSDPFIDNLSRLPVSASSALGDVTLDNVGDVHTYPTWRVVGPGRNFLAVSPSGERLSWKGSLGEGEMLVLDAKTGTVVDGNGVSRYEELDDAPRFWSIPPGRVSCRVELEDITPDTRVTCGFQPRKWVVI